MIDKSVFSLPKIKATLGLLAGLSALRAVLICFQAWSLAGAITGLWNGELLSSQWRLIAVFFVCFVGRKVVLSQQDRTVFNYAKKQTNSLRRQLMQKIFALGPELTGQKGSGNLISLSVGGVDHVETYLRLTLLKVTDLTLIPLMVLIPVFVLDPVSGIILLSVFPLIILFMILLGKAAGFQAKRQYKTFQILANHFVDSLRGIETLKLFGRGKQHADSIFNVSEAFRKRTMKTLTIAFLSGFSLDFFSTLSVAVVALGLGIRLLSGSMLLLPALMVLILSPEYFFPIRHFAGDYHATLEGQNAMAAVKSILEMPEQDVTACALPKWQRESTLSVKRLNFSYAQYQALHDVSFHARGFQKIGVVGMSGSGKSTLIKLLGGFIQPQNPQVGEIFIEDQKVNTFNLPDWQRQAIFIPQNPYIFHATLRENITFYHPQATDEAVNHAIQMVGLEKLVAELPDGMYTQVGEGARVLSGGEAQRIALTRALLDPARRILLFDEPTAHLDIETEVELKKKMLPLMEGKLVFFATHRLHWMQQMDAILVLENGRVAEFGSGQELMKKNGAYCRLVAQIHGRRYEKLHEES
ncbi:MAG: thiol reductant ABC exporter subunit CydD [Defluviitaleaceae bacterium]|nr:thiol reductant ABC exporter subunit CydD [Defluviitaleaceae bacterium]